MPVMITSPSDWNRCAFKQLSEIGLKIENLQGEKECFGYLEVTILQNKVSKKQYAWFEEPFAEPKLLESEEYPKKQMFIKICKEANKNKNNNHEVKWDDLDFYSYQNGSGTYWGTNVNKEKPPITSLYEKKDKNKPMHDNDKDSCYAMITETQSNNYLVWTWDARNDNPQYSYVEGEI